MSILYLHGFRSTPLSAKARQVAAWMQTRDLAHACECPQLPASPADAAQLIQRLASRHIEQDGLNAFTVIGSSLGGYYATWLAERLDCRCVLLNPAVHPDRDLNKYIGVQTVYGSDQTIEIKPEFMRELLDLSVAQITRPERYLLVAATGDEVLDWREMAAKYPAARHLIIQGSDHSLSDFDQIIDEVLQFATSNAPH